MSIARVTEILNSSIGQVKKILTESDSFPYTTDLLNVSGVAIANDGASDTVTVAIIADGITHTINCTIYNRTYVGTFKKITSINVTAGTTYQIELRGII